MSNNTTVVNIFKDHYDVYIGRAGHGEDGYFGNPFRLGNKTRGSTLTAYKEYFLDRIENDPEFKARVLELKGKILGCFCKPYPCHGDVIVKWLDTH